jgi:hypothetical protein
MTYESKPDWDAKDWQLLEALQQDARLGYAELGRPRWPSASNDWRKPALSPDIAP